MHKVYILQSQRDSSYYTGTTINLLKRIGEHNEGTVHYSKSKRSFKLVWYCAFMKKERALEFEKYLKQGSGHAFAHKHFL